MASVRKNSFQSHLLYSAPALFDKRPRFGGLQRRRCRRRRRRTAEGAATDPRPKRGARSDYHNMPPRGGTSSTDHACHSAAPRPCGRGRSLNAVPACRSECAGKTRTKQAENRVRFSEITNIGARKRLFRRYFFVRRVPTAGFFLTFASKARSRKMFSNRTAQNWWWRSLVLSKQ